MAMGVRCSQIQMNLPTRTSNSGDAQPHSKQSSRSVRLQFIFPSSFRIPIDQTPTVLNHESLRSFPHQLTPLECALSSIVQTLFRTPSFAPHCVSAQTEESPLALALCASGTSFQQNPSPEQSSFRWNDQASISTAIRFFRIVLA